MVGVVCGRHASLHPRVPQGLRRSPTIPLGMQCQLLNLCARILRHSLWFSGELLEDDARHDGFDKHVVDEFWVELDTLFRQQVPA